MVLNIVGESDYGFDYPTSERSPLWPPDAGRRHLQPDCGRCKTVFIYAGSLKKHMVKDQMEVLTDQ